MRQPRRSTHGPLLRVLLLAVLLLAGACSSDGGFRTDDATRQDPQPTFSYLIPEGAGEAYDAGTPLEILPARLDASIGDIIEIRNDDERGHLVGPFYVAAGETLRQEFASEGEFIGECTVHSSGEIVVVVS